MRAGDGRERRREAGPTPGPAGRLRRSAGRWEDALSVTLGLLAALGLVVAWMAGSATCGAVHERAVAQAAERTAVQAVVTDHPGFVAGADTGQQAVAVSWTAPDGSTRSAATALPGIYEKGEKVTVWTGPDGSLEPPPSTAGDAVTSGVAAAVLAASAWAVLLLGLGRLGFRATTRRCARAWGLAWAEVEPLWSGRRTPDGG